MTAPDEALKGTAAGVVASAKSVPRDVTALAAPTAREGLGWQLQDKTRQRKTYRFYLRREKSTVARSRYIIALYFLPFSPIIGTRVAGKVLQ
jgi:hypothetical protein